MKVKLLSAKMKAISAAVAFALSIGFLSPTAEAGLQSSMESIFNSMTNTSKPGMYEGVSRGMITGGGVSVHNKIVSTNIIAFSPPSWKIGCGGIDFFGGSFSMIDADQLVQVMRAIAANASGYAFSLAVDFISSTIGFNIKDYLTRIQEWIRKFSNSCEMSKAVVDTGWNSEPWQSFLNGIRNAAKEAGLTRDSGDAAQENNAALGAQTPEGKEMLGNIVYKAIMQQKAADWEMTPGDGIAEDDELFAREMMSLYGTVIVSLKDKSGKTVAGNEASAKKDESNYDVSYKPPLITFTDVFNGGKQDLYKCTGKGGPSEWDIYCTEIEQDKEKFDLPQFKYKIIDILLGENYRKDGKITGVVAKWHDFKTFGQFHIIEEYLISNLPPEVGSSIWLLAKEDPKKAAGFIESAISALTIEILNNMVKQFSKAVRDALSVTKNGGGSVNAAIAALDANDRKLHSEADDLRKTYGDISDILKKFGAYRDWTIYNNRSENFGLYGDEGTLGSGMYKFQK